MTVCNWSQKCSRLIRLFSSQRCSKNLQTWSRLWSQVHSQRLQISLWPKSKRTRSSMKSLRMKLRLTRMITALRVTWVTTWLRLIRTSQTTWCTYRKLWLSQMIITKICKSTRKKKPQLRICKALETSRPNHPRSISINWAIWARLRTCSQRDCSKSWVIWASELLMIRLCLRR